MSADEQLETLDEATANDRKEARFWHSEIKAAGKCEAKWRERADLLVERYRDESDRGGTRLNIFWANTQILKPAVFSATPAPDVRRRTISEDPNTASVGREVATMLEKGLSYAIDAWGFDPPMYAVRDDMLIVGRGVSREVYEADIVKRQDVMVANHQPQMAELAPKEAANYVRNTDLPAKCRTCSMFLAPGGCTAVAGKISPTGHCDFYNMAEFALDGAPAEPDFDEQGYPFVEQKADERVITRYVFWSDFRMSPARCWEDVWWIAFRHPMTRDQLEEEFGEAGRDIPLSIAAGDHPGDGEQSAPKDPEHAFKRAEVWEVWNKRDRERVWIATGHKTVIRKDPDPLNLSGFFPMPRPIYAVGTTDTMVPVPEFCLYQDQADELDEVQDRIRNLTRVLKDVKIMSGDFIEMVKVAEAKDGDIIPTERDELATDLRASIWENPITNTIQVILGLVQRSEQLRNFIYEVTGISDLMRGATKERETAQAQGLKGQYGQVRMTPRSQPMHEYVRDALRIKAEIMAEMFDRATLERIAGMPVTPEMEQLLRDEKLRNTNVEVATDSTIRPDKAAEKQEAIEYVGAVMGFLQQASQIAQAAPPMIPLLMQILKAATRPFKFGRQLEEQMDQTADALTMMAQQMMQQQLMAAAMPQAAPAGEPAQANGGMMQ